MGDFLASPPRSDTIVHVEMLSRVRGFAVGYCLGDAMARAPEPYRGPLLVGTPSLLFLASLEGVIRGLVRRDLTGRADLAPSLWHATARWAWATRQGDLPGVRRWRDSAAPQPWPDGWLAELSVLALGRGSAPAVEEALGAEHLDARPGHAVGDSAGDLVLSRTLPVALLAAGEEWSDELGARIATTARDVAAYSHGLQAQVLAVALTRSAARSLSAGEVLGLCDLGELMPVYAGVPHPEEVADARTALRQIADQQVPALPMTDLARAGVPAGPRTALRALTEGLRCVQLHPSRHEVDKALREAVETGQPAAAAVAGALLGGAHGLRALPVDAVTRLDLGYVADQLAGDLVHQMREHPAAGTHDMAEAWLHRYPAW